MAMQDTTSPSTSRGQISFMLFGTIAVWWGGVVLIIHDSTLNVTTELGEGRMPMILVWFIDVIGSAPLLIIAIATIWFVSYGLRYKVNYCLWLICLLLAGTPISVASGTSIATYLWRANQGGIDWENILPPTLGLVAAFALALSVQSMKPLSHKLRR